MLLVTINWTDIVGVGSNRVYLRESFDGNFMMKSLALLAACNGKLNVDAVVSVLFEF